MMNLKSLSFEDLGDMQIAIEQIRAACATLAGLPNCGGQLLIDMTPGEPVRISTHFAMPPVVDVQDSEPVDLVEAAPQSIETSADHAVSPAVDAKLKTPDTHDAPATASPTPIKPVEPAPQKDGHQAQGVPSAPRTVSQAPVKKGPLDTEERETIERMAKDGTPNAEIAKAINRRSQVVGLYVAALVARKSSSKKEPTPQPSTAKAAPVANSAPVVQPEPVNNGAEAAISKPLSARASAMLSVLGKMKPVPDFDAEIDLEVVEAVFDGQSVPMIATDFGLDGKAVAKRFATLTSFIRDTNGALIEDDKGHLLASLRRRVQIARGMEVHRGAAAQSEAGAL